MSFKIEQHEYTSVISWGLNLVSTQIIENRTQLEIILDLPFGFPINNLISLGPSKKIYMCLYVL